MSVSSPVSESHQAAESLRRGWLKASAFFVGRTGRRLLKWTGVALGILLVVLAIAWGFVLTQILPRADAWRFDLAEQATRALGVTVRLGPVQGQADGIWPTLTLNQVELLDERGQVALSLPQVSARISLRTLSPVALLSGEVRLDRLTLVRPELDVRRDASGVIHVAGLKVSSARPVADGGQSGLDWVLSQPRIQITQGTVRWTDELRGAQPLALQQVELLLRNGLGLGRRKHELALAATPSAAFGRRFELQGDMYQPLWATSSTLDVKEGDTPGWWQQLQVGLTRPTHWQTWSGKVRVALPHVDVQRLKQHLSLPVDINGGHGAVSGELSLRKGEPRNVRVSLSLQDVQVRLAGDLNPLAFKALTGEVVLQNEPTVSTLSFSQLAFVLQDGLSWPASSGRLSWQHAAWKGGWTQANWASTQGGSIQAERLDLALLAQIADRLPLAEGLRQRLAEMAPRGVVSGLDGQWAGQLTAPSHYKLKGQVTGLGLAEASQPERPGLSGADVRISADERGGQAELTMRDGWLAFPGVFEDPRIELSSLRALVNWTVLPAGKGLTDGVEVKVTEASFANSDAQGTLTGTWRTGRGQPGRDGKPLAALPGVLDLSGRLQRAQASSVWRYLPVSIPSGPREYVRLAMKGGQGEDVGFEVRGNLDDFPFQNDLGGRFRVRVPLKNVTLDYVPPSLLGLPQGAKTGFWPAFTGLDGLLVFEGQRMLIQDASGRLGGVGTGNFALRKVEGRIDNLGSSDPHLMIKGQGEGPLNDLMRFLALSPINEWTGHALSQAQGTGAATLQLSLDIPLDRTEQTKLKAGVLLTERDQANLRISPSVPVLSALKGAIHITESQLNVQARARVWGHDATVEGARGADGVIRFSARGQMSADGLRQSQEYPILARLAQHMQGETPFNVAVTIGAKSEVTVSSSLQGMGTTLPAPLNKPAQAVWPLQVTHRLDDALGHQDELIVDVGNPQSLHMTSVATPWLRVDFRRDISGANARVTRGLISLQHTTGGGGSLSLPTKGVTAQVMVNGLDLDAWIPVGKQILDIHDVSAPANGQAAGDAGESYVPDSIAVRTPSLTLQKRTLRDVNASVAHPEGGVWRVQLTSQQAAGQLEWVPERAPLAKGSAGSRLIARLSRLAVPKAEAQAIQEDATEQMLSPEAASLPALDVAIDQFEWAGLPLGRIEVEAINRLAAGTVGVPEWRLTKFRMKTPEAQLDASGSWAAAVATSGGKAKVRPRSNFTFGLDLANSGALLTRLGLPQTMKGGKGRIAGQVSWSGSPLEPDPPTMSGDLTIQISEGQFLKVEPGAAKLLGVLSLQSLPRRLTLDFRDLFQQGFAFDAIDGDVKITQGVAATRNLRMRGVQAVVLMEGQADLAKETQNLHVYVVPQINAEGASLAYAAINPVVGLGTFIAQYLLRKQMADVTTQEFLVTGPWGDPQVDKVGDLLTKPRKPS
ncbi:YhdP family protein [Aquabacterium sp.]|uniref:YhdP family protein n=1 Tax=Aquabacterium sp. TaxID=1872578 RepID=UPI003BF5C057